MERIECYYRAADSREDVLMELRNVAPARTCHGCAQRVRSSLRDAQWRWVRGTEQRAPITDWTDWADHSPASFRARVEEARQLHDEHERAQMAASHSASQT